jgi:hypothetical protein
MIFFKSRHTPYLPLLALVSLVLFYESIVSFLEKLDITLALLFLFCAFAWLVLVYIIERSLLGRLKREGAFPLIASQAYTDILEVFEDAKTQEKEGEEVNSVEVKRWMPLMLYVVWLAKNNLFLNINETLQKSVDAFIAGQAKLEDVATACEERLTSASLSREGLHFSLDYFLQKGEESERASFYDDVFLIATLMSFVKSDVFSPFHNDDYVNEKHILMTLPPVLSVYQSVEPLLDSRLREWKVTYKDSYEKSL